MEHRSYVEINVDIPSKYAWAGFVGNFITYINVSEWEKDQNDYFLYFL